MNRKQRRKAGIKTKVPIYNLTQEQFDNAVNARIRAKESEYINQLMQIVTTVPMWVLRTKYGYGRDRLNKFIIEFNELVDLNVKKDIKHGLSVGIKGRMLNLKLR